MGSKLEIVAEGYVVAKNVVAAQETFESNESIGEVDPTKWAAWERLPYFERETNSEQYKVYTVKHVTTVEEMDD